MTSHLHHDPLLIQLRFKFCFVVILEHVLLVCSVCLCLSVCIHNCMCLIKCCCFRVGAQNTALRELDFTIACVMKMWCKLWKSRQHAAQIKTILLWWSEMLKADSVTTDTTHTRKKSNCAHQWQFCVTNQPVMMVVVKEEFFWFAKGLWVLVHTVGGLPWGELFLMVWDVCKRSFNPREFV